jgi:uncharacterized protein YndB with AHSA1/START domain
MNAPAPGDKVVIRRRMEATPEELFDAWTDAAGMGSWMCPGDIRSTEVTLELRVGGVLLIVMRNAHESFEHRGRFTAIERPRKLAFTWIAAATEMKPTLVTVEFLPVSPTHSELVITHESLPSQSVRDQYNGGWASIAERLDRWLAR